MTPKIVDKQQRKSEIADVALELFIEKGYDQTSVAQVAKQANIGKGTVYEYFSSKEELILEALQRFLGVIEQQAEQYIDAIEDPKQQLKAIVEYEMHAVLADPRGFKLMMNMMHMIISDANRFKEHHHIIHNIFGDAKKIIIQTLEDGVEQGVFKRAIKPDAGIIAHNIIAFLDGISMHYLFDKEEVDLHKQIDHFLDNLICAISA